jgi:hypothetical protein
VPGKSYYRILNLKEGASKAEIKKSYRTLVKKYHPDVSKDPDAHEKYLAVNEAYEALLDPKPRRKTNNAQNQRHSKNQKWNAYKEQSRKRAAERAAEKAKEIQRFYKSLRTGWRRGWIKINVALSLIICGFVIADQFSDLNHRLIKITGYDNLSGEQAITTSEGDFTLQQTHSIIRSKKYLILFETKYLKQTVYVCYNHDGEYKYHRVLFSPRGPSFYWGFPIVIFVSLLPILFFLFARKNNGWFVFLHYATLIITTPWIIYFVFEHPEMIQVPIV